MDVSAEQELALDIDARYPLPDELEHLDAEALASFNLRRIRAVLGVSQQEIADRLGRVHGPHLSQSQIAKIERGERPWRVNEMFAIARALNLPFTELFQGLGANGADLVLASARIALYAAEYEEGQRKAEYIEAKRKVRDAEDAYLRTAARLGIGQEVALHIMEFRYYVGEAKEVAEAAPAPEPDDSLSREAAAWAKRQFEKLREEVVSELDSDEDAAAREATAEQFAEMIRSRVFKRSGEDQ